ncbi:MAG: serine hydrolase [Elusimicrobia bacterium]|nr:serine hydrolase [Elusimicrobiota bacterium]
MKRLPARRFALDRTDAVVVAALLAVGFSYFIGSGLDWSQVEAAVAEPSTPVVQAAAPVETVLASAVSSVMPQTPPALPQAVSGAALEAPDPAWNELVRRLAAQAIGFDGRVAVYLKDLQKGRVWAYHADDLFPSASLIKLPVMISVFNKIAVGDLSLQTRLKLEKRHRTGGSGSLKWYRDGSQFTVRQLLEKMIDESDNTATRMLIDEVGIAYLQQQFAKMGLVYTEIYPEGLSLKNTGVTYENYTTAREMAGLLDKIYRGEAVDRYSSQLMVDILKRLKAHSRLAKYLPSGWEIAHKTGLLRRACHDSSIIFSPKGDYIMVVLTGQNRDYTTAKDFISKLGQLTYRYYENDPSFYARATEYRVAQRNRGDHDVD